MAEVDAIPGLDGERRQQVATGLWSAWWEQHRGAAVLTGFSGLGKTEQVVRPLIDRAIANGRPAVLIDVPLSPMDLDKQLTALLVEELNDSRATALAETAASQPSFSVALRELLRCGALVVLDETQRLLNPSNSQLMEPLATTLQRIAKRPADTGCLWLVSSREVDPIWAEPFYRAVLEPPSELTDLQRIVLTSIGTGDAEQHFPSNRRLEVVRRLGANPRALRLLGNLLRLYPLEELLGPAEDVPEAPVDQQFTQEIERTLLTKAREGLSNAAGVLLRELTVLREPAQWELVEAIGGHLGDVRVLSGELRGRYLLEVSFNRYRLHPLVREVDGPRLRSDEMGWRAAHRSAGTWYARLLHAADHTRVDDAKLAIHLAGAQYHLIEAQASDELREAMRRIQSYIERNYGYSARRPINDVERDAQIALLDLYLKEPGAPGVEFHFANVLNERAAPGDLSKALPHSERATVGQDFHDPWVLWIKLLRDVVGLDAAVKAAKVATKRVAPAKNLYSIYQLLGLFLSRLGRIEEAVNVLLEGETCAKGSEERLIQEALFISAAENSVDLLHLVRERADVRVELGPLSALGNILFLEHQGNWQRAAQIAESSRGTYSKYLYLAHHEVLSWLGAGEPQKAWDVLERFYLNRSGGRNKGTLWLSSLVCLQKGDLVRASEILADYLDAPAPKAEENIRAALLRIWDFGAGARFANPALTIPILPPTVTGLGVNVFRPQYGPPVLPQHQSPLEKPPLRQSDSLRILAVATEWQSGHGGLSTFNRQLCRALVAAGAEVVCLVLHASPEDQQDAGGVRLVEATRTPGQPERDALSRKPRLPDGFSPDVIIGHGRVTGPAAQILAEDHFPAARRLHFVHMAPDEIEWFKLDRDDDAGALAEARTQIELDLGRTAARVIAVGPRLYNRYLRDLSAYDVPPPLRLDPGFDAEIVGVRTPPPGAPWSILLLGRLEDYYVKGIDIAAKTIGLAASRRQSTASALELMVRGARPDTSAKLQSQLREWSGNSALSIIVRPFTTNTETLDADIRRASLVLMPSRAEGFGLVGLEAIVAGTPVLASNLSGLGELLREALGQEQSGRIVVPITGDFKDDTEAWARAVEGILRDREAAFVRASEVLTSLARQKSWATAIERLLTEIGKLRAESPPTAFVAPAALLNTDNDRS